MAIPLAFITVAGGQWNQWDLSEMDLVAGRLNRLQSTVELRCPVRGSDPHRAAKPVLT